MRAKINPIDIFTDRGKEIAIFRSLWKDNASWILCFHGDIGIGKSLLIDWLFNAECRAGKDKIWAIKIDFLTDDCNLCDNISELVKQIVEPFGRYNEKAFNRFKNRTQSIIPASTTITQNVIAQPGATISEMVLTASTSEGPPDKIPISDFDDEIVLLVESLVKKQQTVFFFDHYELLQRKKNNTYKWLWSILNKLHQHFETFRVVLACQDEPEIPSQFVNQRQVVELEPFSDSDVREFVSKLPVKLSSEDYDLRKINYFTRGYPLRLWELAERLGVDVPSISITLLRQRVLQEIQRRESRAQSLKHPISNVVKWASLLRRFDLQFLNNIPGKPYENLGWPEYLQLRKLGFKQAQDNCLMSPRIVRETVHFMIYQEHADAIRLFYEGAKEISLKRREEAGESFFYDEIYYDFMLNHEIAYLRWRTELQRTKQISAHDRYEKLIAIGEEVQFILKEDIAGEIFFELGNYWTGLERWHLAHDAYRFSQELLQEYSPDRAAEAKEKVITISHNILASLDLSINQIPHKQNQERIIYYLAAQRQLYDDEKRWTTIGTLLMICVAILGTGALAIFIPFTTQITWITLIVVVGEFSFLPSILKRRQDAVKIQELIDCELFELEWDEVVSGRKPEPEIISLAAERFRKKRNQQDWETLKNWYYLPAVGQLPLYQARVFCQRQNILWDSELRRTYARWIFLCTGVAVAILFAIGLAASMTLVKFFQGPLLLSLPILALGLKHGYGHYKAANRLDELRVLANDLWVDASKKIVDREDLARRSRKLQDEIFRHRSDNSPVFSWFYNKLRKKYQRVIESALFDSTS